MRDQSVSVRNAAWKVMIEILDVDAVIEKRHE